MANIIHNSWEDDIERLVLFADIMGFKDRVLREQHDVLKSQLIEFKEVWSKQMQPFKIGDHLRFSQYSDSIVIVVNGTDEQKLNLITKAAVCLMQNCLKYTFPIKGAIAKGVFTYDENRQLFFGQPLIDAFLLQEEIKFYGIVAHHTIEHIIKNSKEKIKQLYSRQDVPLEKVRSSHYVLKWNKIKNNLAYSNDDIHWEPWIDKIEEQVSGRPRVYVDNTRNMLKNMQ